MRITLLRLAPPLLAFAFALPAAHPAGADGSHEEQQRKVKIVACEGGERTLVDVDDLALGETRDVGTSCGKTVSVTRTVEDELRLTVDGKEIRLPQVLDSHELGEIGEGKAYRKVIVHKAHDGEGGEEGAVTRKVHEVVVRADGEHGEIDAEALVLLGGELGVDCEDGEDCETEVIRLLEEEDGESPRVVVIKKRHRQAGDGEDEE